ncbi:hypothetical protein GCM10017744_103100 [Streptomyces antimycoticus]|uniref:Uncharacterized protein n=1 Tax=Streptomyces antimycoticus TaxID=68175 RepID=A0A4D4KMC3_9ACTN|nr:hypothetical protein [Streptomyces antimycoticus]GDY49344.1 hypothetical protein SANT12839_102260 [Streptomyces antimycoticus]
MPVYLARNGTGDVTQELEAPTIDDAVARAAAGGAHLAWPSTAAAASAELDQLARALTDRGVPTQRHDTGLVLCDPSDTAGIHVRTTRHAPHALYLITATAVVPFTHAASVLAYLQPAIAAAARSCDGCHAEPGEPCLPNCLPDPSTA